MVIEVNFETYERYDEGQRVSATIKGKDLRSCLLMLLDTVGLYDTPESLIYDEVNEIGHRLSDEELLNKIIEQSGDGSDYIFSIKNADTGEMLYDSGYNIFTQKEVESRFDNEPSFEEEQTQWLDNKEEN